MNDFSDDVQSESSDTKHVPLILIADDDPSLRLLIKHVMYQCDFQVIEADNGLQALELAAHHKPDLIIMDAVMPEMDGFQATQKILELEGCCETPVLMATSLDDDHSVERAFLVGASDYVTKPFNWSVLKHRIKRILSAVEVERKIRHIAYHDSLTGLPNRILFTDRIAQAINRVQREGGFFALLYIDIDHFKVVNDSIGHAAGDNLLNIVATRLKELLRKSDTISRLGGDEFAVIIEGIEQVEKITTVARNILDVLQQPVQVSNKNVNVGASIGVAMYPQDGTNFGSLLKNADTAMYRAKDCGRNTFRFYAQEMSEKAMRRLDIENQLISALERDEFTLFYQPKIDLSTQKISGAEVLVRWNQPQQGLVAPCVFIPVAEETDLIIKLDQWVLKQACEQLKCWQNKGLSLDNISINISSRHLKEGGLLEYCQRIIAEAEIAPEFIEVELTESALVDNSEKARTILSQLKQLGIRIALDDFGTGYASMSYLKEFPFDTVKIDRSFISGVPHDEEDSAIIRAMIQLAQALRLNMVAEGVEVQQQLEYLVSCECQYAQGFFWSKPVPADEFEKMLKANS